MRFILNEGAPYRTRREAHLFYKDVLPQDWTQSLENGNSERNVLHVAFLQAGMSKEVRPLHFGFPEDETVFTIPFRELQTLMRLVQMLSEAGPERKEEQVVQEKKEKDSDVQSS